MVLRISAFVFTIADDVNAPASTTGKRGGFLYHGGHYHPPITYSSTTTQILNVIREMSHKVWRITCVVVSLKRDIVILTEHRPQRDKVIYPQFEPEIYDPLGVVEVSR